MEIKRFDYDFSVCKVKDISAVDFSQEYCFIGKTDEELSVVCLTNRAPEETLERDDGWKAFRIQGVLDFSLISFCHDFIHDLPYETQWSQSGIHMCACDTDTCNTYLFGIILCGDTRRYRKALSI